MIWAIFACSWTSPTAESPSTRAAETVPDLAYHRPTTSADKAIAGIEQQIASLSKGVEQHPEVRGRLYEALKVHAGPLGHVSDYDRLLALGGTPQERARALMLTHRFDEALALEPDAATLESIQLARGENLEAIVASRRAAAEKHPHFRTWAALADALAAAGEWEDADAAYAKALDAYRDVSPIAVAVVQFGRGRVWGEGAHDPVKARALYTDAVRVLGPFVAANVHLAELEAEAGHEAAAIARLKGIAEAEDPEPHALLAELLDGPEAERHRALAEQGYRALLAKHELAFADHATEFYLGAGANPAEAHRLAQLNLANRKTDRSRRLAAEAAKAAGHDDVACELARTAPQPKEVAWGELRDAILGTCG